MYELIYMFEGKEKRVYPQTTQKAQKLVQEMQDNPIYQLVSCEACNNYEAYKAGSAQWVDFLLSECEVISLDEVTEEMEQDAVEHVIDAPFEYDKDLAYFILCEYSSFTDANDFYREVTA